MPPTPDQELAVLKSVIYASLFDYPLTLAQLRQSLVEVAADEDTIAGWWQASPLLQSAIEQREGLFFPTGREDLLVTRSRREALSRHLLHRNRRMLALVANWPFVRMVALSGSLAHLNAEGSADVDLFVITSANRVWTVTVGMLAVSRIMGWRKRLCMNYVISERQMAIAPADLFSANQIIHLQPLVGHDVYRRFVDTNRFVGRYYPGFRPRDRGSGVGDRGSGIGDRGSGIRGALERVLSIGLAPLAERVCRALYRWHLRRRSSTWQSSDQVRLEPECLKLHTSSHRAETMARFERALAAALQHSSDCPLAPCPVGGLRSPYGNRSQCQRAAAHGRGRSFDAAAVRAERRARSQRP